MNAVSLQRGSGKGRDPWAIRRWLSGTGQNMADIARTVGTYNHVVSDTVRGLRNHKKVLAQLEKLGCPQELLYPLRNKEAA